MGTSGAEAELVHLPIGSIVPGRLQPRRRFDEAALAKLTESIRTQGVVQPVLVRPSGGRYELIAGERRWRAAQAAGLATVPAVVRDDGDTDALLLALVENVAREDLSPIEEARGYVVLLEEFDLDLSEIATKVGRSKPSVSNRMRLLELPDDVLELLEERKLSEGHARAVLAVPDHEERRRLARPDRGRRPLGSSRRGRSQACRRPTTITEATPSRPRAARSSSSTARARDGGTGTREGFVADGNGARRDRSCRDRRVA